LSLFFPKRFQAKKKKWPNKKIGIKRKLCVLFFLSLLVAFSAQNVPPTHAFRSTPGNKPKVELEISFEGIPEYNGKWQLTITLEAGENLGETEIWVERSEGLKVESGSLFWHGHMKSGEKTVIEISMRLTAAAPQEVTVNLVGRTTDGRKFSKKLHRTIAFISEHL